MSKHNIELLYGVINRSLFRTDGKLSYDRVTEAIIRLAEVVHETETDEFIWGEVGEHEACNLGDLIVGAYWHYTEWHFGQWSDGYRALSVLGRVFSPGMSMPERDNEAYVELGLMAHADVDEKQKRMESAAS